jgi:hypothetical protein
MPGSERTIVQYAIRLSDVQRVVVGAGAIGYRCIGITAGLPCERASEHLHAPLGPAVAV